MNRADFTEALELELQLTGRPFDRRAVLAFVEDCWPLILDRLDVGSWTEAFWAVQGGTEHLNQAGTSAGPCR